MKIISLEGFLLRLASSGELDGLKDSATNGVDPEPVLMNEKTRIYLARRISINLQQFFINWKVSLKSTSNLFSWRFAFNQEHVEGGSRDIGFSDET